jgi:hypothetical protein
MARSRNHHRNIANLRHYTRRIVDTYRTADRATKATGAAWYLEANAVAQSIADVSGIPLPRVIACIAALSPRNSWAQNVKGARTLALAAANGQPAPIVAGTLTNRAKAWAILNGADIDSTLTGPKVRAFYANISGDFSRATVDVWAMRAATGGRYIVPRKADYPLFESAYQRAASILGVTTAACQAVVWVAVRGAA